MTLLQCQLIAGYVWHRSAWLEEQHRHQSRRSRSSFWRRSEFCPGSFRVSRDTHSERSHKVPGTAHMITDVEGEVQEVSSEFLDDYMADGAVLGHMVQEAGEDDGFATTYTCFETGTSKALQELEDRPSKKSGAPRPAGGRLAPKPKLPRQLPLDGGVDSAEDEVEAESHGAGMA